MEKMPYRQELDMVTVTTVTPQTQPVVSTDWRTGLPVLASKRVVLRELRTSDAASLFAMLTTEEVAGIFNVHPGTVIRWRSQGMLQSEDMDFNWRRAGRRYTIAAVAEFAEKMGKKDGGRTPARFERWYSSKSA